MGDTTNHKEMKNEVIIGGKKPRRIQMGENLMSEGEWLLPSASPPEWTPYTFLHNRFPLSIYRCEDLCLLRESIYYYYYFFTGTFLFVFTLKSTLMSRSQIA